MIEKVCRNIGRFAENDAFIIHDTHFTYREFGQKISNIRAVLETLPTKPNEIIGVVTSNDLETYATIYALWFSGLCFVPINPLLPTSRNEAIIAQTNIRYVLSSKPEAKSAVNTSTIRHIPTANLPDAALRLELSSLHDDDLMYILFTSGSTGTPKGVPINRRNLNSFIDGFYANGYTINEHDRFLQMFDFTFDVSVKCYVAPLVVGASVHTVPLDGIKFLSIIQTLDKNQITVAELVPSVIAFLRPYFKKINLPHLKLCIFTGEALYDEVVAEFASCVPNATIENYYGPTEATVGCLFHTWSAESRAEKTHNGIVSIGKPFGTTRAVILNSENVIVKPGEKGELCIAGNQITPGYWQLPERNKTAFVTLEIDDEEMRFYRTGDLVYCDNDGDYMYCGRIDHQVQVQGFRVELGELEHYSKQIAGNIQVAALAKELGNGNTELYLFLENCPLHIDAVSQHLQQELPFYMQPTRIINIPKFPLTTSGKVDRNRLMEQLNF